MSCKVATTIPNENAVERNGRHGKSREERLQVSRVEGKAEKKREVRNGLSRNHALSYWGEPE